MRLFLQTPATIDQAPKFYQLILQQDLLGGWSLIRQWGWHGERGAQRREHFDDYSAAESALIAWRDKQLGRGFRIMYLEGN